MTSDMTSEEHPVKMTGQEDNAVRMAGYLDKRGKMKLVTTWKRYWFVLKDQLLLYYKSQEECLNLSACRGSLNMGLVSSVRPGAHRGPPASAAQGFTIEVETRTQAVVLRTKHRSLQEQWLKALLESMALPNISSPVRTGGGPVHFRYSTENLPAIEEAMTEDKKGQTLPHQTSVASQDKMLGRIKRIGGKSYGGGLDTILRHQPKNQKQPHRSPQQPNIPRIKAVDRMLGVHYLDSTENTEILISENQTHGVVNEEKCPSDSTCSASKDEVLMPNRREEIKCNEVLLQRPVATSSDIQEVREINFKLKGGERNKQTKVAIFERGENKNHEKLNILSIEKARKYTTDFLENERYVYSSVKEEEILVENKLYEKTQAVENEDKDKMYEETKEIEQKFDCCEVENKLYEKNKPDKEDKQYDSLEEFSLSRVHEIAGEGKMYEVVSATVDAVKQVEGDVQSLEDKEEDDYYCSYDKFSLLNLLSDQRNSPSPEPDLPPRPSGCSNDSPKSHLAHENIKTDDDDEADYNVVYESTESYNTSTSPSHLLLSSGVGSEKKRSKLRVRMKLRKKKAPTKESVPSEDGSKNNKRKRKLSFLRRMLKYYRKKPAYNSEAVVISDGHRISAEPEYESVDYLASMLKPEVIEEELPDHASRSKSTESLDKAVLKERLFGTKNLLTEQALNELKMKLKCRENAAQIEPPVHTKEENKGHEGLTPNEILKKNPVPTPRSKKETVNQNNKDLVVVSSRYQCNDSITQENKPPSLPPRRVARPCSPCHDVPQNNSPIYGNVQDLNIITGEKKEDKNEESPGSTFEKQSAPPLSEWDQEFRDELSDTSCGFVCDQNKWKTAEKSSDHDQQGNKGKSSLQKSPQEEFLLGKCSKAAEYEVKHGIITNNDHAKSDIMGYEHKADSVLIVSIGSSDICSDVSKADLSANVITKGFNSQTEKLTAKNDNSSDTNSQMADNKLSYGKREGKKVPKNDTELQSNGNLTVKVGCTATEHSDTRDDRIVNNIYGVHKKFDLNTTHHEDFSDDVSVTHRKSQTDTISVCNRSEILCKETTKCLVLVSGENEYSSSLCRNAGDSTELKEETKDKAHITINDCVCSNSSSISTDSLVPEEIKTLCHTACSQKILLNEMAKNFSDRALHTTETAGYKDTTPNLHRHSDELNILLAQLAEITSAPLMPHDVASSLVDIPKARNPKPEANEPLQLDSTQQESFVLGPIRRRRYSDPDYDVPRPHGPLLHLLIPNGMSYQSDDNGQSGQENDAIEATRFFGEVDMSSSSTHSSLSLRDRVISEDDEHSDISYYVSMAPDSLEVPLN